MKNEIDLDMNQIRLLQPLFDEAKKNWNEDRPGIVIGQAFYGGQAEFRYIRHEYCKKIVEIIKRQEILFRKF